MTQLWKYVVPSILFLFVAQTLTAGDSSSGGGDIARIYFEEGRSQAVQLLNNIQESDYPADTPIEVKAFLVQHSKQMAQDLLMIQLEWQTKSAQVTCAETKYAPGSPISLSFEKCYGYYLNSQDAGKLLVHETAHHFGLKEETLADLLGIHLYRTWETKKLVELSLCPIKRPIGEELNGSWKLDKEFARFFPGSPTEVFPKAGTDIVVQFKRSLEVLKTFKVRKGDCVYDAGILTTLLDGKQVFGPAQYVLVADQRGFTSISYFWTNEKGQRRDESNIVSLITARGVEKNPVLLMGGDHEDEKVTPFRKVQQ